MSDLHGIKIVLTYREESLGAAWTEYFEGQPNVEITAGNICRLDCDAIVSPANSFGFMDGGLDHQLSEFFGWDLEKRVQKEIRSRPMAELLVGEALIVPTEDLRVPWLICAPTMRVPMSVRNSINAYLAMKAILIVALQHRNELPINSVAIPGLGTGIGKLSIEVAAFQMWSAYEEIILNQSRQPSDFADAQRLHLKLNRSAMIYD